MGRGKQLLAKAKADFAQREQLALLELERIATEEPLPTFKRTVSLQSKLRLVQREMAKRKQQAIDFERGIQELHYRRRAPKELRHSGEHPGHVKKLLELAARVPNVVEPRSPMQSSLAPERFL